MPFIKRVFNNTIKYLFLLFLLLIVLGTLTSIYLLKTPSGNRFVINKLNSSLTELLGTKVHIDSFKYQFPKRFSLYNTLVLDSKNDTVLYSPNIGVSFNRYDFSINSLIFDEVNIIDLKFYGKKYEGDTLFNFDKIIHYVSRPSEKKKKNKGIFRVLFNNFNVSDGTVEFFDQRKPHTNQGIDYDHLRMNNVNLTTNYVQFIGPKIDIDISDLSFKEKSGFILKKLKTEFLFDTERMIFKDLFFKTPYSELKNKVAFTFTTDNGFENFIEEVKIDADFKNSQISFYDLHFFAPDLDSVQETVSLNGSVSGTVDDFRSKHLSLSFGNNSFLDGDISFKGLPNFDETFIELDFSKATLTENDVKRLFPNFQLPVNLEALGQVKFNAKFTGFPHDFVSYGNFSTDLGSFTTDLNLKNPADISNASYSGLLTMKNFDIGKLLFKEKLIGNTTFEAHVKGSGLNLQHLNTQVIATVNQVNFKGYNYKNLKLNGSFKKRIFDGKLISNDQALSLNLNGKIDFSKKKPHFDFLANINNMDLLALGFVKDTFNINGTLDLDFMASNLNDVEGNIVLKNTGLNLSNRKIYFDSLLLKSTIEANQNKLALKSDLADISLQGNFLLTELPDLLKTTVSRYSNISLIKEEDLIEDQYLDFKIHVKNASFLMELVNAEFILEDNSNFTGKINAGNGALLLTGSIPGIYFNNYFFKQIKLGANGEGKSLKLATSIDEIYNNDSLMVHSIELNLNTLKDSLHYMVDANGRELLGPISAEGFLSLTNDSLSGRIKDASIVFNDSTWHINSRKLTYYFDSVLTIELLTLKNNGQSVKITGILGKNKKDPLRIVTNNFALSNITSLVAPALMIYSGNIDGQVVLYDMFGEPYFNAGLIVNPILANDDTIGMFSVSANYKSNTQNVNLSSNLLTLDYDPLLSLDGYINFVKQNNLNLKAKFEETDVGIFEGLLADLVSDLKGTVSAKLTLTGSFDDPQVVGTANFKDAYFTVNYLQTRYHFNEDVNFTTNSINFNNLKLFDPYNNITTINGAMRHKGLKNFYVDLDLQLNNMLVLNTTLNDNSLFYGTAFASGPAKFTGPIDELTMKMQLKSEKNSVFYLPVYEEEEYTGYDFIRFIDAKNYFEREYKTSIKGLTLNMDLELTPDLETKIIFDPKVGDILEGQGSGDLKLEINPSGDFFMYGDYVINSGNYLFTAFDVVNKRFKIQEGGSIKWSGDPYNADIKVTAAYDLRASVTPLLPSQENDIKQKVPVEAILYLSGALFSPDVKLDFDIADNSFIGNSGTTTLQNQIRLIKNDEQELNKQVVSLLVFNRFIPVGQGIGAGVAAGSLASSGVGDLVSNQLNYLLSQVFEDSKYLQNLQIGVDWRANDFASSQDNISRRELELALSTSLFDDRVSLSGSYDVENISGNFEVSYKITEDGKVRVKVFNRSSNNPLFNQNILTQGAGIFWKKEFDSWGDLFDGKSKKEDKNENNKSTKNDKALKKDENYAPHLIEQ